MHLNGPLKPRPGLVVIPALRGRKESFDAKELFKALAEDFERLNIVVRPVDVPVPVVEVHIGNQELAASVQELRDLPKFLSLNGPDVFKHTLGYNNVKVYTSKLYGPLGKVRLNQVRRRIVDRDIDPVIMYISVEQVRQCGGPATHIEQVALSSSRKPVDNPRGF